MIESRPVGRYRVSAKPLSQLSIPVFGGSMIRGVIGHALRRRYCRCGEEPSQHQVDCLYKSLFEAETGQAFVITPPPEGELLADRPFEFFVTLLKDDVPRREALLHSLILGFRRGFGPKNVPCEVITIEPVVPEISPLEQRVRLELLTPWFIKYRGKALHAHELTTHSFLIAVAQRQRMLVKSGLLDAAIPDNRALLALADTLEGQFQVYDVRGARRSNRQNSKHPLNGIAGSVELQSSRVAGLRGLTSMLYRGQWLHGGGKASFGLGALRVLPIPELQSQLREIERMTTGEAV